MSRKYCLLSALLLVINSSAMNLTVPSAEAAQATQINGEKQSSGAPSILRNATPMNVSGGVARRSGSVGTGYEIYSFEAEAGDVVTIDVDVTRILQGTEYADDDSQLFLFDSQGRLIAENDDEREGVFQSKIVNFRIPRDGTYFVGVSTFDNNPNLNSSGVITGWGNNGSSRFEYNLSVQGLSQTVSGTSRVTPADRDPECIAALNATKARLQRDSSSPITGEIFEISSNAYGRNYPRNQPYGLSFSVSGRSGDDIMNSSQLLTSISQEFLSGCQSASLVSFGLSGTDYVRVFGLIRDEVIEFECLHFDSPNSGPPYWGQFHCV